MIAHDVHLIFAMPSIGLAEYIVGVQTGIVEYFSDTGHGGNANGLEEWT